MSGKKVGISLDKHDKSLRTFNLQQMVKGDATYFVISNENNTCFLHVSEPATYVVPQWILLECWHRELHVFVTLLSEVVVEFGSQLVRAHVLHSLVELFQTGRGEGGEGGGEGG